MWNAEILGINSGTWSGDVLTTIKTLKRIIEIATHVFLFNNTVEITFMQKIKSLLAKTITRGHILGT